jgi:hypothetical protein
MRIAIITGGLEPGRDGVGDYSRSLAVEATRQGAACRLLALADRHTTRVIAGRDESGIEMLRLPFTMRWTERVRAARQFLAASPGEWVSLQFVPYSFQRWGVASKLVRVLPELVGRAQLHVMFHEVWIDGGASLRRQLLSVAQRRAVQALAGYPPALMHTSNATYEHALAEQGIRARKLPLFGSVPVGSGTAESWLGAPLAGAGCDALSNAGARRGDWWLFAFFGSLHPVWPPQPLLDELRAAAAVAGKQVALAAVGRLGAGESIWERMQQDFGGRMPMLRLGEQPGHRISEVFNTVDFGVATSPLALIGKSATVAAMLDHGLPVVVNRNDCAWPAPDSGDDREAALVIRMGSDLAARLRNARRLPPCWRLPTVASQWLGELAAAADKVPTWSS